MSSLHVCPSSLKGHILIPPSKSQTMRALVFAAKAQSPSVIHNWLPSPDTLAMVAALRQLGTEIAINDHIAVTPKPWVVPNEPIRAGNSGQVYRFIRALAPVDVVGDESIRNRRPIQPLLDGLGQLPHAQIDGADSQPVSGLLMAMAFRDGASTLRVVNPGERPWVGMTLSWFDRLGIPYVNHKFEVYSVQGPAKYPGFDYTVPTDCSSAAFIWAANLLGAEIQFTLDRDPAQGDQTLFSTYPLSGGTIDINDFIDSLPILAVLGCFAKSPLRITGAAIARKKESDRIYAMTKELTKMGAQIRPFTDGLLIYPSKLHGANLYAHKDHRVAMALIIAAMNANGPSTIEGHDCIAKSFPNFINQIKRCTSSSALQVLEKAPLA